MFGIGRRQRTLISLLYPSTAECWSLLLARRGQEKTFMHLVLSSLLRQRIKWSFQTYVEKGSLQILSCLLYTIGVPPARGGHSVRWLAVVTLCTSLPQLPPEQEILNVMVQQTYRLSWQPAVEVLDNYNILHTQGNPIQCIYHVISPHRFWGVYSSKCIVTLNWLVRSTEISVLMLKIYGRFSSIYACGFITWP